MRNKLPSRLVYILVLLLIPATACQPQVAVTGGPPAAASTPTVVAPPNDIAANTATPPFQGAVPVDLPPKRADQGADVNSSVKAERKVVTSGEVFIHGLYERPFNANTMDKYFPYLDIVDTQAFKDDTWGYATISLANTDSNAHLPGQYAVELDLNKDGRGEGLIRASGVASTQWSTQGVQAWKDTNGDVGGSTPMSADTQHGDGYETLAFDQGKGSLVDGAWARIKPDDPKTIEIAFKLSMLDGALARIQPDYPKTVGIAFKLSTVGGPASYALGAWAGTNIDPAMFDYNDHLTHAQAGSPLFGDLLYPIKDLAEIDNTCRLAVGFEPTPYTPGLCSTLQQQSGKESTGAGASGAAPAAPPPPPPPPAEKAPPPPPPPSNRVP